MHVIGKGRYAREAYPERQVGGAASALAREWADNPQSVAVSNAAFTTLASVTITPKVTGKLRVTVTGKVIDTSGAQNGWQFLIGQGAVDPLALIYQPGLNYNVPAGPVNGGIAFALVFDWDKFDGTILPIGVPVRIGVAGATTAGAGSVPGNGVQIEVQEVF